MTYREFFKACNETHYYNDKILWDAWIKLSNAHIYTVMHYGTDHGCDELRMALQIGAEAIKDLMKLRNEMGKEEEDGYRD